MEQSGVLGRILQKWRGVSSAKPDCLNPNPNQANKVDFKIVVSAFCILGGSIILCLLILIFEILNGRNKSHST